MKENSKQFLEYENIDSTIFNNEIQSEVVSVILTVRKVCHILFTFGMYTGGHIKSAFINPICF